MGTMVQDSNYYNDVLHFDGLFTNLQVLMDSILLSLKLLGTSLKRIFVDAIIISAKG